MNFSTFQPFNLSTRATRAVVAAVLCAAIATTASAAHVRETMTLTKGWNAVYLESTPVNAACADFFAGAPVERVASYQSDAYTSTRQIADDGTPINQKPLSYFVWLPGDADASTMTTLVGGRVYMIYATDGWSSGEFLGVPAAPQQTWRTTSGETGFMNLAGISVAPGVSVPLKAYFGEGPFGAASGVAYKISGSKASAPTFLSLGLTSSPKVDGGKAYALTATTDGDWPGVIGVQGSGVDFGSSANYASITVRNCGTTNHTFRFKMVPSDDAAASGEELPPITRALPRGDMLSEQQYTNVEANAAWDIELAADEHTDQVFGLDRSKLVDGKEYGAILVIEDLGASKMRVRVPITVAASESAADAVKFPAGLWSGFIQLETVSRLDDTNQVPVKAGGTMKMSVMMHVAPDGAVKLLQRVAAGVDTNGTPRLFRELESVPATVQNARRFSTVMMSIDNPVVEKTSGEFGKGLVFDWTVGEKAADNPFRHAWHPDHDGKTADYKGETPSGDDLANYAGVVKPELWSIGNRMEFSWHKNNDPHADVDYEWTPAEKTAGYVTWTVSGLTAKEPIVSFGVFVLQRAIKAGEVE